MEVSTRHLLQAIRIKLQARDCNYQDVLTELNSLESKLSPSTNRTLLDQLTNIKKMVLVLHNASLPSETKEMFQPALNNYDTKFRYKSIQRLSSAKQIEAARRVRALRKPEDSNFKFTKVDTNLTSTPFNGIRQQLSPTQTRFRELSEALQYFRQLSKTISLNKITHLSQLNKLPFYFGILEAKLVQKESPLPALFMNKSSSQNGELYESRTSPAFEGEDLQQKKKLNILINELDCGLPARADYRSRDLEDIRNRIQILKQQRKYLARLR